MAAIFAPSADTPHLLGDELHATRCTRFAERRRNVALDIWRAV